jgi:predicted trehalose synthase
MLRSFHHATYAGFQQQAECGVIAREHLPKFEPWVRHWNRAVSRAYLQAYCRTLEPSGLLPRAEDKLHLILVAFLLNQVMDELGDELQLHSDHVRAPLQAILHLTDEQMLLHITGTDGGKPPTR